MQGQSLQSLGPVIKIMGMLVAKPTISTYSEEKYLQDLLCRVRHVIGTPLVVAVVM